MLQAPGYHEGYKGIRLPGVMEALQAGDATRAREQADIAARLINNAGNFLMTENANLTSSNFLSFNMETGSVGLQEVILPSWLQGVSAVADDRFEEYLDEAYSILDME